jgi:uncharacterized RDD family membrane protein YckC
MVTPPNNLYAPPKSAVADVAATDADAEKATRGSRLAAKIIDALIFGVPFLPSYMTAWPTIMGQAKAAGPGKMGAAGVWSTVAATGMWFYVGVLALLCTLTITAILVHRNGQTIGKKCMGIKIVRKDASRVTLARVFFVRYLANTILTLIPVVGSLYGLVDILFIFGEPKRCCHDYIADTIVIKA